MLQLTHRLLAWGVLGLATGGCLFLPTHPVVFRSIEPENPAVTRKFRGVLGFSRFSLARSLPASFRLLIGAGRGLSRHQLRKARIVPQGAEFVVPVNVLDVFVTLFHRFFQIVQGTLWLARPG